MQFLSFRFWQSCWSRVSATTDSFLCPPPRFGAGTGTTQAGSLVVSAPGMVPVSFLSEPDDVKIDAGTLLPVRCRVSGFAGPRYSMRCWSENDLQGEQKRVGQRNASSLRCLLETDARFHVSESKGLLHGRRRRGARTVSSSRFSSSAQGVFLRVLHAFWGLLRRVQMLFLLRTVLSRLILSRYVWNLLRHVSSASLLLCMVITLHVTHIIHRIHTACMVLVVFRIRRIRWERFCVLGGTKSLSTSTRCGVGVLLWMSPLIHSRRLSSCMLRRGQASWKTRTRRFSRR